MSRIGYLDLPCGLSGEMLLGCLIDCGWTEAELRAAVAQHIPAGVRWLLAVQEIVKGALRATVADLMIDEENRSLETAATVYAAEAGIKAIGIKALYASASPKTAWSSRIVQSPTWDDVAGQVLSDNVKIEQPAMRIDRIGIGADRTDHPWPNIARLWIGVSAGVNPASTR